MSEGNRNGDGGVLRKVADQDPWKQWLTVVAVVSMSFMAGMNTTGVIHTSDKSIHQSKEDKESDTRKITEPLAKELSGHLVSEGHAVMAERVSRHETEAARQFTELSRQLEALRATQQQILIELRKK